MWVASGGRTLHVLRGIERSALRVDVARGPNELGDIVLPFATSLAGIGGVLHGSGEDPEAEVELVALDTGHVLAVEADHGEDASDGTSTFRFPAVPPGEYRVRVLAFDGRRYEPRERTVSPPALDLEFRTAGALTRLEQRFLDADGTPLDGSVLARLHGRWRTYEGYPSGDVERWVALAADGRFADATLDDDGVLVARFEPGWGRAVFFSEAGDGSAPLADVEVFADGRLVATSDAAGLALLWLAAAPDALDFRRAGWSVHSVHDVAPTRVTLVRE